MKKSRRLSAICTCLFGLITPTVVFAYTLIDLSALVGGNQSEGQDINASGQVAGWSKNIEWSFNYSHAFSNDIKGQTVLGPNGSGFPVIAPNTNGSLDMEINTFGVSFGYLM